MAASSRRGAPRMCGHALMWPGGPGPWLAVDRPLNSEGVRNLDRTFKIQRRCLRQDRGSPAMTAPTAAP